MKKPAKVILGAFSVFVIAWAALSAYFTVAGLDLRDDSFRGQYGYSRGGSAPAGVGESVDPAEEVTEKP